MSLQLYQTRHRLITAIKKKGPLAVGDLAEELNITGMAVRKHLASLERDGLVLATLERRDTGRPRYIYSLTPQADQLFPQSYHQVARDLLNDVGDLYGPEEADRLLGRRSERMEKRYDPHLAGKATAGRVARLAQLRDDDGFLADWEEDGDGGFILREHNCPLLQVASDHPAACSLELQMFRRLIPDADISRSHCQTEGQHVCLYRVKPKVR